MTEKKDNRIRFSPSAGFHQGAVIVRDGILFGIAADPARKVDLVIYRAGTDEILLDVPMAADLYSGNYRCMLVQGAAPSSIEYLYRIDGELTMDPAARLVHGRQSFGIPVPRESLRGAIAGGKFDWGEEEHLPGIPFEDVIAYALHVRGFTMAPGSGVRSRGTFRGLEEKIPYLKDLGINQVILMPAYDFNEVREEKPQRERLPEYVLKAMSLEKQNAQDRETEERRSAGENPVGGAKGKVSVNYWGFTDGFYFAPKAAYAATSRPDQEMKHLIRELHRSGMELVMKMAFPDDLDISFMEQCLVWWAHEYHVDGFLLYARREAASILAKLPSLCSVKLMTGYYDLASSGPASTGLLRRRAADCNDGFKDDCRKLLKGDENMLGAFISRFRRNEPGKGSMNYITSHDGFTLMDLVSYDRKHNEANGEENRDGAACDFSWNCGAEGPTRKKTIQALRLQQMRNAFAMLLLSQGTPMLLAGDEFGNSQEGNNNPYGIDSTLTWVTWKNLKEKNGRELHEFVRALIALRKGHRILHPAPSSGDYGKLPSGNPEFSCHTGRAWYGSPDYQSRHIGMLLCGMEKDREEQVYIAWNFHWEEQVLALPCPPRGTVWMSAAQTAGDPVCPDEREIHVPGRCVIVLLAVPAQKA